VVRRRPCSRDRLRARNRQPIGTVTSTRKGSPGPVRRTGSADACAPPPTRALFSSSPRSTPSKRRAGKTRRPRCGDDESEVVGAAPPPATSSAPSVPPSVRSQATAAPRTMGVSRVVQGASPHQRWP
jgi:hypothetical protein